MTSQAQIEDELLAHRLQNAELLNTQRQRDDQTRQDEELARRLAAEEAPAALPGNRGNSTTYHLQAGQKSVVRLHHHHTRRQIGEIVLAHYVGSNIMQFELINNRGKLLRVNRNGAVDFAAVNDDSGSFIIDAFPDGTMCLLCKSFTDKINATGTRGWYLSMTENGQLSGNGGKTEFSRWTMIAAQAAETAAPAMASQYPVEQAEWHQSPLYSMAGGSGGAPAATPSSTSTTLVANPTPIDSSQAQRDRNLALAPRTGTNTFPGMDAGREALMNFFNTPDGIAFLKQPEYTAAYKLYQDNRKLSKILHRPDWATLAVNYEDCTMTVLKFEKAQVDKWMSYTELKSFYEFGCVVGCNIIPTKLLHNALRIINWYLSRAVLSRNHATSDPTNYGSQRCLESIFRRHNESVELVGDVSQDNDILAMYYCTPVVHIVQQFIGCGEVDHPVVGQVVTSYPRLDTSSNPAQFGNKWYIDGFTATGGHSPYNILVGIALTDISNENQGNFCVHQGSQMILSELFKEQVHRKGTLFSEDPDKYQKPDLGVPKQLLMHAGDVFFCSQRTAHLFATNTAGSTPTTIVYFRISHRDHQQLKDTALDSLWVEFKSATYYLESADEAAANKALLSTATHQPQQQQPQLSSNSTATMSTPVQLDSTAPVTGGASSTSTAVKNAADMMEFATTSSNTPATSASNSCGAVALTSSVTTAHSTSVPTTSPPLVPLSDVNVVQSSPTNAFETGTLPTPPTNN